jgi:hypothetical protein
MGIRSNHVSGDRIRSNHLSGVGILSNNLSRERLISCEAGSQTDTSIIDLSRVSDPLSSYIPDPAPLPTVRRSGYSSMAEHRHKSGCEILVGDESRSENSICQKISYVMPIVFSNPYVLVCSAL